MPMNLRARQQLAKNGEARGKQAVFPTLSPPQEPRRNAVAGRDKAISGEQVVQRPTSLNRAAKSLNNLLIKERPSTTLQPATPDGPVPIVNARKRKHGQTVEVQIETPTKALGANPASRLNLPTRSKSTVGSSALTRGDLFDVPQASPEPRMKRVKTRGTQSEATTQPDREFSSASVTSPPHRSGLRSQKPRRTTSQSAITAAAMKPKKRGPKTKRQSVQGGNRTTKQNKKPTAPIRKSPTPSSSEYDTGLEEQEQLLAARDETQRNASTTALDQEEYGGDKGDQENGTAGVNGQDEEENDYDAGSNESDEHEDSQSGDDNEPEDNDNPQGEIRRDEYTKMPLNIYGHGGDWRLMMKRAAKVKFKGDVQLDDTWVTTLMGRIKVVKGLFKEILRHDEASGHARGLEIRLDTSLTELKQWLNGLSSPPLQEKKAVKKEDAQKSNQLYEIYGAAIPSLISVLKLQLCSRYRDHELDMKDLNQLIRLQKAVIVLCKKAKAWNACIVVNYGSPKVKKVHSFITLRLEMICAAFEDDLGKRKDAKTREAAQARRKADEEGLRREEDEEKLQKEERKREDEERRKETAGILARRKRERAKRMPLPSFLLHASQRGTSIERSRSGSLHTGNARSSAPASSQHRSSRPRRRVDIGSSRLQSSSQRDEAVEDDVALSDWELASLVEGLAQFKGKGKDRVARILEAYGSSGEALEFLTPGHVRTHIESLKNGGLSDDELDFLGLR